MSLTQNRKVTPTRFVGFDTGGEVFLWQKRLFRGIYQGKGALYLQVLRICEQNNLFPFGIVETRVSPINPYPDLPYDLIMEHERIPFISYPHEWPGSMLKIAALRHINLFLELNLHGLTIKDWHPYNILFKGTEPVFVDFTSIIPEENLQHEAYLTPPRIPFPFQHIWDWTAAYYFEMYQRMFVPYFLLPLYLMKNGQNNKARTRLLETTLNARRPVISPWEVFNNETRWRDYKTRELFKKIKLVQRGPSKRWFFQSLRKEVEALSVAPKRSGYTKYYSIKNEEVGLEPSADWTNKQRIVYESLKRFQPKTVLDVACNTGWYSILAATLGCQVASFDIDEGCIDILYNRAKKENLPISPMLMDVAKATVDVPALKYENEPSGSLIGGDFPLILSAEKRLRCDMVLALAIVHHLALGQGQDFRKIVKKLSAFTYECLLVEFVAKDDKLIVAEPTFFPAFNANPHQFDWYTLDGFVQELRKHFRSVEIKNSFPETRFIAVCIR